MKFDAVKVKNLIVEWIRSWFEENGKGCNAVIGISGGKDSSVVAALCVAALGKDRVIGVLMPDGEQSDIDCSRMLVDFLDIKNYTCNVKAATKGVLDCLDAAGGRSAVVEAKGFTVINDCYNANPDSMKSAIESLAMCPGKKVAVLGDMYELGGESVNMHREMGETCVKEGIDKLITCGELGADIGAAAKEAGMTDVTHFASCESLAEAICGLVKESDYVLVKASHGLHLEAVVDALLK